MSDARSPQETAAFVPPSSGGIARFAPGAMLAQRYRLVAALPGGVRIFVKSEWNPTVVVETVALKAEDWKRLCHNCRCLRKKTKRLERGGGSFFPCACIPRCRRTVPRRRAR